MYVGYHTYKTPVEEIQNRKSGGFDFLSTSTIGTKSKENTSKAENKSTFYVHDVLQMTIFNRNS